MKHPADAEVPEPPPEEAVEHDAPHPSTMGPDPDEKWPEDD